MSKVATKVCNVVKGKSYEQMSRQERKVAIAKDVQANIWANKLNLKSGNGYLVPKSGSPSYNFDCLLDFGVKNEQIAEKLKEDCQVCLKGAFFLCKVSKFNNYSFDANDYSSELYENDTVDGLKDAFTRYELDDLEEAFENEWSGIKNDDDRVLAICQNIIDNRGNFDKFSLYEVV